MLPNSQHSVQSTSGSEYGGGTSAPQLFSQNELNDLIRDLNLSKQASELLASRLKENNFTKCHNYNIQNTKNEILPFFSENEELFYCKNISKLLLDMSLKAALH